MKDDKLASIIADKILLARKKAKLSQLEVAAAIGLSRVSICNIETARHCATVENLIKMAKIYGCSVNDLLPTEEEYSVEILPFTSAIEEQLRNKIHRLEEKLNKLKSI